MSFSTTTFDANRPSRRFVCWSLGLAGAVVLASALLNFWIDPYGCFGQNRLGVFISSEREAKPVLLRRYPHDALLVGNSKMGLVPARQLEGFRFFNASFAGASAEEEYYCLAHFATNQRLVVLEIDFLQSDPPVNNGDLFVPRGWKSALDMLLSAKTLEYSLRTITEHLAGAPASLQPDGSSDATGWFKLYDHEDPAQEQFKLRELMGLYDHSDPAFHLTYYQRIARLLRQRGIPCAAFVPPLHQALADHVKSSPNRPLIERWRREVRDIFPNLVDLSMEPYGDAGNFFKIDPHHFKPQTGVRALNEKVIPATLKFQQTRAELRGGPYVESQRSGRPR